MTAFALVAGWSVIAQRDAARDAHLMRSGYLPLALALRDVMQNQDTWNTQLNHITTARYPADIRMWFEAAQNIGRPKLFGGVRAAISQAFLRADNANETVGGQKLLRETGAIESFLSRDAELLTQLFRALDQGETNRAERLRDQLVTRGIQGKKMLSELEQRVQRNVDVLLDMAKARERQAIRLLIGLAVFTLLVGIVMALYARRVLEPLGAVTERAKAVARGDLTPRAVVASKDEIGDLAATFEGMVSAIARANEQLLAAERLATIGKMAAHVTHEIRNPLSSMALNVELLEEELGERDAESLTLLRAIKNEVDRLTALSEQYLSVARQQPLRLEDEDVGALVREATDFMRRDLERHGASIQVDIEPALPSVLADESQLKQALFNLLRNAREAMTAGGRVRVAVSRAAHSGIDVVVEDEGAGVDATTRQRLFEPFFTTKTHGTGLGLAITRQIVEAHGGVIRCESREPRGTRMVIHLPDRRPEAEEIRQTALEEAGA
jgi:signal transduction histidine kinase